MIIRAITIAVLMLTSISSAFAAPYQLKDACFEQAASRYHISAKLLRAISKTESGGKANAIHENTASSFDIGHMQINSSWLPTLAKFGITQADLLNPCVCTHVGAWVLANNIRQFGYNWKAVGAYNAKSPIKRAIYARKVAANLHEQGGSKAID